MNEEHNSSETSDRTDDVNRSASSPTGDTTRLQKRRFVRNGLLLVGVFFLGGFVLPNLHLRVDWKEPASQAQTAGLQQTATVSANALPGGLGVVPGAPPASLSEAEYYARAAQAASPAVVNIDTQQQVRMRRGFFDEDWMSGQPQTQTTEGSGVIIDAKGYLLTNEHVVGAANDASKNILVTLMDGRKFKGTVVGADKTTDVALVKIEGEKLPVARIGTARGLVPGQMAVAIGNPLGFRFTVTHGVISALGRPIKDYENLIQTDCAINPGNSGGALVNLQGQVIGINTLIISQAQGLGFAIPIDTALQVADELKRHGHVKRPWLGIAAVTNTATLARVNDLPDIAGVIAAKLWRGSPSDVVGLRPGDIITRIDSKTIHNAEEFKAVEKSLHIGDKVKIEVHRADQYAIVTLTVGEAP